MVVGLWWGIAETQTITNSCSSLSHKRDSIKTAAEQSIGYSETKKKKLWFDEDCCIVVERTKQAKLKFLQDPVEESRDNYFERRKASLNERLEGGRNKENGESYKAQNCTHCIIRNIISRRLRWAGHVARMVESRNAYRVLVGRRPLGRPRRRWEDNIKMDLREVGYDDRDWINLAQDRDRSMAGLCEGGNEPPGSLKTIQSNHQLGMDIYTFSDLADMAICYGEARGNGRRALHMYQQRLKIEITLTTQYLLDFISSFETMGLFVPGALVEDRVDIHSQLMITLN
ncbi:hypothetical protein ANN_04401 [Periplaneta americana]|uniref:Uncharacterized protein n=1 Tax=Periplaneta americana TaxID=6978 RepID=A0ABQ8T971_PERAM|nr:hypothetical protein ANN_04401 [Periplaneta americana]